MVVIRRKLYKRGSSFETTIPKPMLFALDPDNEKYDVVFEYDPKTHKWTVSFDESSSGKKAKRGGK